MNKKQIKAIIRRFKYYDGRLNEKRHLIDQIDPENKKDQARFQKETLICIKMFQVFVYKNLPEKHEEGKLPVTKAEALRLMSSDEAKEKGFIQRSDLTFIYMNKEEFFTYMEVYNEMQK